MDYNPQDFTVPEFHTAEVTLPARPGGAGTFSETDVPIEDIEFDRDTLVDRVCVTEDGKQAVAADVAGTSILPLLRMRWWESKDRPYGDFLPLPAIDERRPDLSLVDAAVGAGAGYGQVVFEPKGPIPLRVKHRDGIIVDWANPNVPAGGAAFPGGQVDVSVSGVLEQTGRPYTIYIPVVVAAGAVDPAGLVAASTSPGQTSRNLTGQDLIVRRVVFSINDTDYAALAADPRIWRHLRMMLRLSGKEEERWSAYSERAPLIAFGNRVGLNNQAINIEFPERKLFKFQDSMQMQFRNYAAVATQAIITFCGWKRPGGKSI